MSFAANIVADSINQAGVRLTTFQLRYPRFIHAELMTHRVFSRNASSSRAIPVKRIIEDIKNDTAMPIHWGKNQPGMQAKEEHDERVDSNLLHQMVSDLDPSPYDLSREEAWFEARDRAIAMAEAFNEAGYHKQIVNRLLEPFSHINVVVSATDWANWYALRAHEDAQPEIKRLAELMAIAHATSKPRELLPHEWHLPFADDDQTRAEIGEYMNEQDIKLDLPETLKRTLNSTGDALALLVSAARCGRVSYKTFDGKRSTVEKDIELFGKLAGGEPLHASPLEHQARATDSSNRGPRSGNFRGWQQFRKFLPNEAVTDIEYKQARF